jgi:hypothetical protein
MIEGTTLYLEASVLIYGRRKSHSSDLCVEQFNCSRNQQIAQFSFMFGTLNRLSYSDSKYVIIWLGRNSRRN